MRTLTTGCILLMALGAAGCSKKSHAANRAGATSATTASTAAAPPTATVAVKRLPYPGTQAGAEAMMKAFLAPNADTAQMSKQLRPSRADYEAVLTSDVADQVASLYDKHWNEHALDIKPRHRETQVIVQSATTEDIRAQNDKGKAFHPYAKIADHLKPGVTWYMFNFVIPGNKQGLRFRGLVFVNGHWAILPELRDPVHHVLHRMHHHH